MTRKHGVSHNLFKVAKELGYIVKIESTSKYRWAVKKPNKRHLNRVIMMLNSMAVPKKKKMIVKLFWGLITYEK
jgi:hypothetical protein